MSLLRFLVLFVSLLPVAFATPRFLSISDIHYGTENVSKDGNDTGPEFLKITMAKFKELIKDVDFIINLGDLPTHMLFASAKKADYERTLFHDLYEADKEAKPMFYAPGNNDSLTGNYQPFTVDGKSPLNYASDWAGACVFCKGLIIDDSHMQSGGYYSSYVIPGNKDIMLIALNTAPFANVPILAPKYPNQEADALAELAWFKEQLKEHSAKQLLIGFHIPLGVSYKGTEFWHQNYLKQFTAILADNTSSYGQITLLAGHTHMDELRKIPLPNGVALYEYSTAAVSRIHHNNPAIKIMSLDKNMKVDNYTTYYTSHLDKWGDEHYEALGAKDAIFSQCQKETLSSCLDSLTDKQVCAGLEHGFFYGAKSDRVIKNACYTTYLVNS